MLSGSATITKWVGDGSEGGKLDVITADASAAGSTIAFASATQGTPFNVRVDAHKPVADSYYEVKVTELSEGASLGVGLVAADGFRPGWKTKGYFYNGNITNGSAGLIIGFGDRIKEGDVVGAYQRRLVGVAGDGGRRCSVIFYHSGRCLGAGFSLDDGNEMLFPCLHVTGSATVTFSTPPPPTIFEREPTVYGNDDRYSGDWSIDRAFVGPELGELPIPEGSHFKVSLRRADTASSENDTRYLLRVTISNSFRTSFAMAGKMEAFDEIEFTGHCMATRMMPRPAAQKMEKLIGSALGKDSGFRKMLLSEQGQLIMSGPTAEIMCSRYTETFEPMRSA